MIVIALVSNPPHNPLNKISSELAASKDIAAQVNTLFLKGDSPDRAEQLAYILKTLPHGKKVTSAILVVGCITTEAEADQIRAVNGLIWHLTPLSDIRFIEGDLWAGPSHPYSNPVEALAESRIILAERFLSTRKERQGGGA